MNNATLKDVFIKTFQNDPKKVVYEYYSGKIIEKITYKQLKDKIYGIALILKKYLVGIPDESWVILQATNDPWDMAVLWALIHNNMNVLLLDKEVKNPKYIIKQSSAKAIITSYNLSIQNVKSINIEVLRKHKPSKYLSDNNFTFSNKIALCTSGTSGNPKIFVHTGTQIYAHINSVLDRYGKAKDLKYNAESNEIKKTMLTFKFHHIASVLLNFMYPYIGGTIVKTDEIGIKILLDLINSRKVQNVYAVPMIWDSMVKYIAGKYGNTNPETIKKAFGDSLRLAMMGAAKPTSRTVEILNGAGIFTTSAYGMTEIGSLTSNISRSTENRNKGIAGKVGSRFYEVKVKKESGILKSSGTGELLIRGKIVYYSQLVNGIEIVRDSHEYFHTGDIVKIESDDLYIIGRVKDIIVNTSGENIYIDELELKFNFLRDVGIEYTIIGINDEPILVIYMSKDNDVSEILENISRINNSLEIYTRIKEIYFSKIPLFRTSTGKIKRNTIKDKIVLNNEIFKLIKSY